MTAGGLPTPTLLLDDGTGTFPYDITTFGRWVEGITGTRGRQDELSQVTAPTPGATLDNQDGRFSYGSTLIGSPSPILIDQRVQIKYTANGTTVNRYGGTLIASNPTWPGGGDEMSIATITLADVQAQAERRPLRSVIEEEILLDAPTSYYTLGEPAGVLSAADSSGNQSPALTTTGSGAPVVFGTGTGPATDGLTAATFAGGQYLTASASAFAVVAAGCYFLRTGVPAAAETVLALGGAAQFEIVLETSGKASLYAAGTLVAQTAVSVCDGLTHHAFLTATGGGQALYVDGALVGSLAGGLPIPLTVMVGGGGDSHGATTLTGTVSHVALFNTVPSAARILAYYQAGTTGFAGESGTARLTRIAGYAGLAVGTLDPSLTNIPFVDITGMTVMAALQAVADAEFGLVFFDGSGNLTFHNRNRAVGKTSPDITIDANKLDPGTAFYYDSQGILNYLTVTAQGTQVTQVVRNTVSELGAAGSPKHGRYPDSKTYLVQTDAEALDRGNWLVNRHGQPAPRAGSLVVNLLDLTAAQQAAWLAVEPNTWVRITGLPAQTPGGTTADLIVQGWSEVLNETTWSLTLNTASRPAFYQAWILDDTTYSVLDSTTRLFI